MGWFVGQDLATVAKDLPCSLSSAPTEERWAMNSSTASVLCHVNAQMGVEWELDAKLAGGIQGGAWRIHWGSEVAVLKWQDAKSAVLWNPDARRIVEYIRLAGYPTPAWLGSGRTPEGHRFTIQSFVQGQGLTRLDRQAAAVIVELVDMQRTLSPQTDLDWAQYVTGRVFSPSPVHRLPSLAGGEVADVLDAVLELAGPYTDDQLPNREMVHSDLSISNILMNDGRLAAVVDMDSVGRGCAVYDLLAGCLNGVLWDGEPDAVRWMQDLAIRSYGPGPVAITGAALVIGRLGWQLSTQPEGLERTSKACSAWLTQLHRLVTA